MCTLTTKNILGINQLRSTGKLFNRSTIKRNISLHDCVDIVELRDNLFLIPAKFLSLFLMHNTFTVPLQMVNYSGYG